MDEATKRELRMFTELGLRKQNQEDKLMRDAVEIYNEAMKKREIFNLVKKDIYRNFIIKSYSYDCRYLRIMNENSFYDYNLKVTKHYNADMMSIRLELDDKIALLSRPTRGDFEWSLYIINEEEETGYIDDMLNKALRYVLYN